MAAAHGIAPRLNVLTGRRLTLCQPDGNKIAWLVAMQRIKTLLTLVLPAIYLNPNTWVLMIWSPRQVTLLLHLAKLLAPNQTGSLFPYGGKIGGHRGTLNLIFL